MVPATADDGGNEKEDEEDEGDGAFNRRKARDPLDDTGVNSENT